MHLTSKLLWKPSHPEKNQTALHHTTHKKTAGYLFSKDNYFQLLRSRSFCLKRNLLVCYSHRTSSHRLHCFLRGKLFSGWKVTGMDPSFGSGGPQRQEAIGQFVRDKSLFGLEHHGGPFGRTCQICQGPPRQWICPPC